MKEKKLFYWILCGISVLEIILGGSRGPLVGVGIFGILLILRFFKEMDMRLRVFLIVASIFALILFVGNRSGNHFTVGIIYYQKFRNFFQND